MKKLETLGKFIAVCTIKKGIPITDWINFEGILVVVLGNVDCYDVTIVIY